MGKIEVPLDKLASRLGMGILALVILIVGGGMIIALDQGQLRPTHLRARKM